jgi:Family of unknown function (DUF5681)
MSKSEPLGIEAGAGYGKPPPHSRFRKGQSGNPRGRPKGSHRNAPFEAILGQTVTVREEGNERRTSASEAFLLQLAKRGLEGDSFAARMAVQAMADARQSNLTGQMEQVTIVHWIVAPGSVNSALEPLRMAKMLFPTTKHARVLLEPWLVESALERLEGRQLNEDEQRIVLNATRTPQKVKWPEWWTVFE